jgi:hypothetical protein
MYRWKQGIKEDKLEQRERREGKRVDKIDEKRN